MKKKFAIINFTTCNISSITSAFKKLNINFIVTDKIYEIELCDGLILPGVGSFRAAMNQLKKKKIIPLIKKFHQENKLILGICLGMQILMTQSNEFGINRGLNLIKGKVFKLPFFKKKNNRFSVPNIGWRTLECKKNNNLEKFLSKKKMYFVHSYFVKVENSKSVLTKTQHGNLKFCSSLKLKNTYGFQFHPEKSRKDGLMLYRKLLK
jgi:imidazole glycerol-phosphate synthase subunit HisH